MTPTTPSGDPSTALGHNASFVAAVDPRFAHGVHLLALSDADRGIAPGYVRGDARIRETPPVLPMLDDAPLPTLEELLIGSEAPPIDRPWFERRWAAGASAACLTAAERAAREAAATPSGGLLAGITVRVIVAPALRADTVFGAPAPPPARAVTVACGLETPGALVVLGAIAARLPADARLEAILASDDLRRVRLHIAGSVLSLALGDDPAIADVLARAAEVLLPPQHQGERTVALVQRLANAGLLDQPPGEIERLGRGLSRRYADRLHRAWRRGFFVPRGGDVAAWVDALRAP